MGIVDKLLRRAVRRSSAMADKASTMARLTAWTLDLIDCEFPGSQSAAVVLKLADQASLAASEAEMAAREARRVAQGLDLTTANECARKAEVAADEAINAYQAAREAWSDLLATR